MADARGGDAGHMKSKGLSHLGGMKKFPKRTAAEKKHRMSGKHTDKPYISSSMGDMVRLMQRMACMENTLGMTEPPPPEFYDYWTKFATSKSEEHLPTEFVDKRKVSIPRIKMNTSSFDFTGKHTINADEFHDMALAEMGKKGGRGGGALAATSSGLWNDVRISMSTESFISSSTKVSEPHDNTNLYDGWSDSDDDDMSESDLEMDPLQASVASTFNNIFANQSSHHGGGGGQGEGKKGGPGDKASSKHGNSQGSDTDAKAKGTGSLLQMLLEDQRVAMEMSLKNTKAEHEIVDYFMDDLDDSFLVDAISYGQLPDSAFNPEFDYFNEDPLFRQREKARERKAAEAAAALQPKGKGKSKTPATAVEVEVSAEESDEEETEQDDRAVSKQIKDDVCTKIDYATCVQDQRRRIEDRLRAAVRKRSPMGSYKVPKGSQPMARTFGHGTPGPAAYYPKLNAVKPNPKGVNLVRRWQNSIYETPGPGPAAYLLECDKCTGEYRANHFCPRFTTDESVGPGPAAYDMSAYAGTAKDKPHALILSRHPWNKSQGGSMFPNVYGISRFGRHNPPKALLISKHPLKDKSLIGPGAYDPTAMKDTKVGIILKSRLPQKDPDVNPGFLDLPTFMGTGPGVPLGIRKFQDLNCDSPGPIYGINPDPLGGLSMTFKPFPTPGKESDPCPLEYGTKPGDMSIKNEFTRAPRAVMIGNHNLDYGIDKTPGPNQYDIKRFSRKIGIKMKGNYGSKTEVLPGPADYNVKKSHYAIPPRTIFQSKPKDKDLVERSPGFKYTPVNPNHNNVKGALIAGRWPSKEDDESGPPYHNLFGMTSRGNFSKIPVSLKSRHSPFVFTHVAKNAMTLKQCKSQSKTSPAVGKPAPKSVKC